MAIKQTTDQELARRAAAHVTPAEAREAAERQKALEQAERSATAKRLERDTRREG